MDNVKGKTGFGWIELADVVANPTDTDSTRGALAVVGTTLKFWNKSSWITVDTSVSGSFVELTDTPANYTSAENKILKVNNAGNAVEFVELSGDVTINATGVSAIGTNKVLTAMINDANVTLAKLEAVTSARLIVGNASNRPTAVDVTGDVHINNTGVTTIQTDAVTETKILDGAVTEAKLAAGAGLAALFTSGIAANESYDKTANTGNGTESTIIAADPADARAVLVIVHVDETFSDGDDGTQPTFAIATSGASPIMADTVLDDATEGETYVYGANLPATETVELTATPAVTATDTNDAGAVTITVIALPTA
jgi:hypothetical protein